jgi:hypothetical protein
MGRVNPDQHADLVQRHLREHMPSNAEALKQILAAIESARVMGCQYRAITSTQSGLMLATVDQLSIALMNMQHLIGSMDNQRATEVAERLNEDPLVRVGQGDYTVDLTASLRWVKRAS